MGFGFVYLDARPGIRSYVEDGATGLVLVASALVVGFALFPDGLPVAAEVGLVVAGWTDAIARALSPYVPTRTGGPPPG